MSNSILNNYIIEYSNEFDRTIEGLIQKTINLSEITISVMRVVR